MVPVGAALCMGGGHGRERRWQDSMLRDRSQLEIEQAGKQRPFRNRAKGKGWKTGGRGEKNSKQGIEKCLVNLRDLESRQFLGRHEERQVVSQGEGQ